MRVWRLAAVAAACMVAHPAFAGIKVEANGARADDRWGAELGVGYSLELARFSITPIVGAFLYEGDNTRYYMDDNGGNPRCRDRETGWYADKSECNNIAAKVYGKIEGTFSIPAGPELGAGVRISSGDTTPYGTAALSLAPLVKLKGNVGKDYYALGIRAGF